ncbi:carbohydrate kinase family protein [Calycomorphotria hydatis]|uniref:Putative sugar kinase YdjH n=1 Tax=Calycomorphotria hydatis TaxID=2528027 RepID=A0A517T967_9PLAN|nr:carbohydrate kinase family protein [Calycomorphotria hydatis]QDT64898.1 putative sugar kinase YdjH [Calycomorphotria hydatis]
MKHNTSGVVVAGHICLDIIPTFLDKSTSEACRIEPGHLYHMGKAVCSTGGAVANTGLALHSLGVPTKLIGKLGDDLFGKAVLNLIDEIEPSLSEGMTVMPGDQTSYSIVISPPETDRSFLHCPGANDTFTINDICLEELSQPSLFHFGYPPLMKQMFSDGGEQLRLLFERLQELGCLTSLDMSSPDPDSPAGRIEWRDWLKTVLPTVDLFFPSIDEIRFMIDGNAGGVNELLEYEITDYRRLANQLIEWGARVVVIKLGSLGLYLRSAENVQFSVDAVNSPNAVKSGDSGLWASREIIAPCFEVESVGTTGAGDSTIAGFLAGLYQGAGPESALNLAVAVGACCVEGHDATGTIPQLDVVRQRIANGWKRKSASALPEGWSEPSDLGLWFSNEDAVITNGI